MSRAECSEPFCTTTLPHHTHTDADGRSWCCNPYPYAARPATPTAEADLRAVLDATAVEALRGLVPLAQIDQVGAFVIDRLLALPALQRLVEQDAAAARLRETVERVEALADSWDDRSTFGNNVTILTPEWHMAAVTRGFLEELRRALDGTDA